MGKKVKNIKNLNRLFRYEFQKPCNLIGLEDLEDGQAYLTKN